jgi:hypothetical protein
MLEITKMTVIRTVEKALIATPLMYAAIITATCPCPVVLDCHMEKFYGALVFSAVVAGAVLYFKI